MHPNNQLTVVGRIVTPPELTVTRNGVSRLAFRVVVKERYRKPDGTWEERTDGFFDVVAWRMLAANAAHTLHKGDRVIVTGRITAREFEVAATEDREARMAKRFTIEASDLGPSTLWQQWRRPSPDEVVDVSAPSDREPPPPTAEDAPDDDGFAAPPDDEERDDDLVTTAA